MDDIEYCAFVKYEITYTVVLITAMFCLLVGAIAFDSYIERSSESQEQIHWQNTTINMMKDSKPVDSNCFQLDPQIKIV